MIQARFRNSKSNFISEQRLQYIVNSNGLFTTWTATVFLQREQQRNSVGTSQFTYIRNGASEVKLNAVRDPPLSYCWSGSGIIENLPQRRLQPRLLPSEALGDLPGHSGISPPHTHGHMAPLPPGWGQNPALWRHSLYGSATPPPGDLGVSKSSPFIFWTLPSTGDPASNR